MIHMREPMPGTADIPFSIGDRVTLKKQHPCGGREWQVYRIGADIGLKCLTCGRRVMLKRREAERRTIRRVSARGVRETADDG
jgi:hypothetical protein